MMVTTTSVHTTPMFTAAAGRFYAGFVTMAVGAVFVIIGGYIGDQGPKNLTLFAFVPSRVACSSRLSKTPPASPEPL